ncbi:MAG: hypothetical protein ACFE78_11410, partial [Candidatus Hodarchaeota archaeon]
MVLKSHINLKDNSIGQIFTPEYIAEFMVENIVKLIEDNNLFENKRQNLTDLRILEPSAGRGVFLKLLIENKFSDITAYETDINLKNILIECYPTVKFKFENFLGSDLNDSYDIIIGNPPYLG